MNEKNKKLGVLQQRMVLVAILLVSAVMLFMKLPAHISAMEKQRQYDGEFYEFAQLFSEVYSDVSDRFVTEVDQKKLFEGAIRGMFTALGDPHSQWLSPDSLQQLEKETEGEFSGVGLHITLDANSVLTVIAPIPGTPGSRAGIMPMDKIIEIDGVTTEAITLLEAVKKLTGPTGSQVTVKIFREGEKELLDFTLTRDKIEVKSVFHTYLDDEKKIGYIRLSRFAEHTAEEVKKAIDEFEEGDIDGLVMDLRFNSGGLLDKVIEICEFIFPKGQLIVSTKGRQEQNNREFRSKRNPILDEDTPMVVLVNQSSASASEILAGAIQDTARGVIIGPEGENTFGKGSVQTITYLNNSLDRNENGEIQPCGLRLTTAKYYTPSGRTIHEVGIEPDLGVAVTIEHQRDLLRHGLLGDPDQTGLDRPATPDAKEEKTGEAPTDPAAKEEPMNSEGSDDTTAPDSAATEEAAAEVPAEPFRDIQLDFALDHVKKLISGEAKVIPKKVTAEAEAELKDDAETETTTE